MKLSDKDREKMDIADNQIFYHEDLQDVGQI